MSACVARTAFPPPSPAPCAGAPPFASVMSGPLRAAPSSTCRGYAGTSRPRPRSPARSRPARRAPPRRAASARGRRSRARSSCARRAPALRSSRQASGSSWGTPARAPRGRCGGRAPGSGRRRPASAPPSAPRRPCSSRGASPRSRAIPCARLRAGRGMDIRAPVWSPSP